MFIYKIVDVLLMAFKDSFYYDDYHNDDYFNEYEDLDTFGSINEPSFNDVIFGCGFAVLKQISIQLLSLLAINIVYRLIRQTCEHQLLHITINQFY